MHRWGNICLQIRNFWFSFWNKDKSPFELQMIVCELGIRQPQRGWIYRYCVLIQCCVSKDIRVNLENQNFHTELVVAHVYNADDLQGGNWATVGRKRRKTTCLLSVKERQDSEEGPWMLNQRLTWWKEERWISCVFKRPDGKKAKLIDWKQLQAVSLRREWKEERRRRDADGGVCEECW